MPFLNNEEAMKRRIVIFSNIVFFTTLAGLLAGCSGASQPAAPTGGVPTPPASVQPTTSASIPPTAPASVQPTPDASPQVVPVVATYPECKTAKELAKAASTIVVGTVKETKASMTDTPNTIHQVQIERVLKGDVKPGAIISVGELGGVIGNTDYRSEEGLLLKDGQTYLLFMEAFKGDPYGLVNPVESVYLRAGDGSFTKDPRNPLDVKSVTKAAGL